MLGQLLPNSTSMLGCNVPMEHLNRNFNLIAYVRLLIENNWIWYDYLRDCCCVAKIIRRGKGRVEKIVGRLREENVLP